MQYRTNTPPQTAGTGDAADAWSNPTKPEVKTVPHVRRVEKPKKRPIVLAVAALLVICLGIFLWNVVLGHGSMPSYVDTSKYQLVELSNNHAYYGKVTLMNDKEVVLKDVFYIQAASQTESTADASNKFELIKLGEEMNGPYDTILLNRSQVTLVENLRDDGQVVQKINEYHTQHKQ